MKRIVITGSTRGIGFGLADAFLAHGAALTISGRSQQSVDAALEKLSARHDPERLLGQPCDVTDLEQVRALWQAAVDHFGAVDIWINNAGIGHPLLPPWELSPQQAEAVIDTNVLGSLHGARVAIQGMLQQGEGQLYNMEGFGSKGRTQEGMSIYGTSKAAIKYFTDSLIAETEGTPVQVGSISPGMLITDLIMDQFDSSPQRFEEARGVFNILADRVEDVTPWLAERVLENDKQGTHIAWLTTPRIMWRFMKAPFSKRDLFAEE